MRRQCNNYTKCSRSRDWIMWGDYSNSWRSTDRKYPKGRVSLPFWGRKKQWIGRRCPRCWVRPNLDWINFKHELRHSKLRVIRGTIVINIKICWLRMMRIMNTYMRANSCNRIIRSYTLRHRRIRSRWVSRFSWIIRELNNCWRIISSGIVWLVSWGIKSISYSSNLHI